MDGGACWAAVHGVAKSRTQLSDFPFTFHFHTWEKEMATHSSILAWRIPGTEEPSGLPSVGLHRVGPDATEATQQQQQQHTVPHSGIAGSHSHQERRRAPFARSRSVAYVCGLSGDGHSGRCELVSPCGFSCISLTINDVERLVCPLYIFFEKMSVRAFCLFLNWVVSCLFQC